MAKVFNVDKFNDILKKYNQKVSAHIITKDLIILSNGVSLSNRSEINRCKRRVLTGSEVWKQNFDLLYNVDIDIRTSAEKDCRAATSRQGGINCQKTNGDKIRKNLNTGIPWNKGQHGLQKAWNKGLTKDTHKSIKQMSESRIGELNWNYAKSLSIQQRTQLSSSMKKKILCGEFTPNSNNRQTHFDVVFNEKKYRSSWEAVCHAVYPTFEYEKLRISYEYESTTFVYIVDFICYSTRQVIEVKPLELLTEPRTLAKMSALRQWAADNGYDIIVFSQEKMYNSLTHIDISVFDQKTQKKILSFKKRYEANQKKRNKSS